MRHCGYWLGFLHTRARMRLWACACAFARAGKCVLVHAPARSPPPCRAALGGAGRQAGKLCLLLPPLKLQGRAADVELESLVRPGTVLRPGGQLGTWRYMAPERVLAALAGRRPQLHRRPGRRRVDRGARAGDAELAGAGQLWPDDDGRVVARACACLCVYDTHVYVTHMCVFAFAFGL